VEYYKSKNAKISFIMPRHKSTDHTTNVGVTTLTYFYIILLYINCVSLVI